MIPETKKPVATNAINGHAGSRDNDNRFEHFYAKLSRLEEDIVSGKHPYYKLPEAALQQLNSRSIPENPDSARRFPSPFSSSTFSSSQVRASTSKATEPQKVDAVRNGEVSKGHSLSQSDQHKAALDSQAKAFDANREAPQIASVLLTKSADLVKAEYLLKRQKIERVLKDQLEQKRVQAHEREFSLDFAPELDVNSLLNEALAIVKHVSGFRPRANSNSSASVSIDDNSHYSSRDNGSASEKQSVKKSKGQNMAKGLGSGKEKRVDMSDEDQHMNVKESIEQPKFPEFDHAAPTNLKPTHVAHGNSSASLQRTNKAVNPPGQANEVREESEYSPPAPDQFDNVALANGSVHVRKHSRNFSNVTHRSTGKQLIREGKATETIQTAHSPVVPIIRNHIEQPLAPQPARVSPLAVTKMPRIAQSKQNQLSQVHNAHYTASQVPPNIMPVDAEMRAGISRTEAEYSGYLSQHNQTADRPQSSNSRKRPREVEEPDIQQIGAVTKRVARSPIYPVEPVVKEEPLSPAPVAALRPARRRLVMEYPDDIEYLPRRESVNGPAYYAESSYSRPAYRYEYEDPTSPGYVDAQPRVIYQRVARENPDLRRTVSLQHVRRRASPVTYVQTYPHGQGPVSRVSSPYYLDRPHPQDEPHTPHVYARPRVSKSPPPYIGIQGPRETLHSEMAPPPPRRLVYGQYRERYEEMPPPERRQSVGPPPRRAEIEPCYESTLPPPSQGYRARRPIPPLETYEDGTYLQRSARPIARRYQDVPLAEREHIERRDPYQRTYSMRPVEDVRVWHDYGHYPEVLPRYTESIERRAQPPARYEEVIPARGYEAPRSYSVHPERNTYAGTVAVDGARATSHVVPAGPPEAPAPPLRPPQDYYRYPSASVPPQAAAREYVRSAEAATSTAGHYHDRVQDSGRRADLAVGARTETGTTVAADAEYVTVQQRQREHPLPPLPPAARVQTRSYSYAEPYHPHGQIENQSQGQSHHQRYIGDNEPYDPTSPLQAIRPFADRYVMAAQDARTASSRY